MGMLNDWQERDVASCLRTAINNAVFYERFDTAERLSRILSVLQTPQDAVNCEGCKFNYVSSATEPCKECLAASLVIKPRYLPNFTPNPQGGDK